MTIVRKRADADCGVAALAQYAGETYEDVYVVMAIVDPVNRGKNGLHNREIVRAARMLEVELTPTRVYDLDHDEGVLRVRWNNRKKRRGGHFVAVIGGRIYCAEDAVSRHWREYLQVWDGRPCTLLQGATL